MVQERGIDNEFIDDVALGFRLNGGGSKNAIESNKEAIRPVGKSSSEFIAGANIPPAIAPAFSVLMTEAMYKGVLNPGYIDESKNKNDRKSRSYVADLVSGKILTSYAIDGESTRNIKEVLGGFMGSVGRRIRNFGRNVENKPYETNGFE